MFGVRAVLEKELSGEKAMSLNGLKNSKYENLKPNANLTWLQDSFLGKRRDPLGVMIGSPTKVDGSAGDAVKQAGVVAHRTVTS